MMVASKTLHGSVPRLVGGGKRSKVDLEHEFEVRRARGSGRRQTGTVCVRGLDCPLLGDMLMTDASVVGDINQRYDFPSYTGSGSCVNTDGYRIGPPTRNTYFE